MATLLLDTHALLWWLSDNRQLTKTARTAIADPGNAVFVSAASAWEIAIKQKLGKLSAPNDLLEVVALGELEWLPIEAEDGLAAGRLPMHHRDPFDRLLIAQARARSALIVSRDQTFDRYDIGRLWS